MLRGRVTLKHVFEGLLTTAKLVGATWGHGGLCWPRALFAAHAPFPGPGAADMKGMADLLGFTTSQCLNNQNCLN